MGALMCYFFVVECLKYKTTRRFSSCLKKSHFGNHKDVARLQVKVALVCVCDRSQPDPYSHVWIVSSARALTLHDVPCHPMADLQGF